MKRFVTIGIISIFFLYGLVLLSTFNIPGINHSVFLRNKFKKARLYAGIGALFTREVTLDNYATSYRFYQNGKWQNWQELEMPLFNSYINEVNFTSLKHNRLDIHLSQKLYFSGYKPNPKSFFQSVPFSSFLKHLIEVHNHNQKPDSIAVIYKVEDQKTRINKQLLTFKCKP